MLARHPIYHDWVPRIQKANTAVLMFVCYYNTKRMKFFNFFKKKQKYKDYLSSENSLVYERIAEELNNNAQHVYELAHGKTCRCYDDFVIVEHLYRHGILHRTSYK